MGRLFCDACNYFQKPVDMVQYGLWPIAINQWIFFSFWTMEVVASLTNFNPLVSHTGIVNAFNFSAKRRGKVSIKIIRITNLIEIPHIKK